MRLSIRTLLVLCTLVLNTVTYAADLQQLPGRVVRIVDGDTIVLEVGDMRHKVRLSGIDSPERNQPWGDASTRELRRQVAGKDVIVEWSKRDRWKRIIGVIKLDGENQNLHLVERDGTFGQTLNPTRRGSAASADGLAKSRPVR